ncbi:unnamed protein product [Dimorphilus gyrociliatus]|uniref:Uncharacterized protein n=1 Tax=Dimorphilus gyrociliatus TaxID=2664684 RepID=A0A7I8V4M3_9ANNE|nr:unnamed protein product [Dimorphilus gyrociliatus]
MTTTLRECNKYRTCIFGLFIIVIIASYFLLSKLRVERIKFDTKVSEKSTKVVNPLPDVQPVEDNSKPIETDDFPHHDKWIVTTSINRPTDQMTKLIANENWRMVVVGDLKTPVEWKLKNTVFLSVDRQKEFGGHLSKLIPFKSYFRKNVGYIYAIKHGAKTILDVDDDNEIAIDAFEFNDESSSITPITTSTFYNPYAHFGQSTLWPRGYPLQKIGDPAPRTYRTITGRTPGIQQAVVDGDPDMDAIFRLTRKNSERMLNLTFDRSAPPVVLRKNLYSPCNAQATLWRYEAFWGLFFYSSVTWREADIFRCYWAQRLLWYTRSRLAFLPPAAVQVRNPHDYLSDYIDELRLYSQAEKFVSALQSLTCDADFEECLRKSATHLNELSFWTKEDVDWLYAWILDLKNVGYIFPEKTDDDENIDEEVVFFPREQHTSFNHIPNLETLSSLLPHSRIAKTVTNACGSNYIVDWNPSNFNNDTLVVVGLISGKIEDVTYLDALYRTNFSNIIYCTDSKPSQDFGVSIMHSKSVNVLSCLKSAYELGYTVKNYIYTSSEFYFYRNVLKKHPETALLFDGSIDCQAKNTNALLSDRFLRIPGEILGQVKINCLDIKCIQKYLEDTFCNPDYVKGSLVENFDYIAPFHISTNLLKFCNIFKRFV